MSGAAQPSSARVLSSHAGSQDHLCSARNVTLSWSVSRGAETEIRTRHTDQSAACTVAGDGKPDPGGDWSMLERGVVRS